MGFFCVSFSAYAEATHLEKLKAHYPYGLIGDDFGLLTEEDLATNTCDAYPSPFYWGKNMAYSYWQCFFLRDTKLECSSLGYDPAIKEETGYLSLEARSKEVTHSYLARDAMEIRECKEWLKVWKKKTAGEKYVCISGSYGRLSGARNGRQEADWVFDKFKTRKGCESHRSNCSLGKYPDKNCVLPANWIGQR